jgi:hypothetical protein
MWNSETLLWDEDMARRVKRGNGKQCGKYVLEHAIYECISELTCGIMRK